MALHVVHGFCRHSYLYLLSGFRAFSPRFSAVGLIAWSHPGLSHHGARHQYGYSYYPTRPVWKKITLVYILTLLAAALTSGILLHQFSSHITFDEVYRAKTTCTESSIHILSSLALYPVLAWGWIKKCSRGGKPDSVPLRGRSFIYAIYPRML